MVSPYPLPRQTRESDIIAGDGRATYGPFAFQIWDTADVVVEVSRQNGPWQVESASATKVAAQPFDNFSVTFASPLLAGDRAVVASARVEERSSDVMRGGSVSGAGLERSLSTIATVLQELRRDVGRSLQFAPGSEARNRIPELVADHTLVVGPDGASLVLGPTSENIAEASAAAAIAVGAVNEALRILASIDIFSLTFGSMAEFRSTPILLPVTSVRVLGYYGALSFGGGLYVRDADDTTSADNGGSVIVKGTVRWKRVKDAQSNNPEIYGAKRNDLTFDSQPAFLKCANDNELVQMPAAEFRWNTGLDLVDRMAASLVGVDRSVSRIHCFGTGIAYRVALRERLSKGGVRDVHFVARNLTAVTGTAIHFSIPPSGATVGHNVDIESVLIDGNWSGASTFAYWNIGIILENVPKSAIRFCDIAGRTNSFATSTAGVMYIGDPTMNTVGSVDSGIHKCQILFFQDAVFAPDYGEGLAITDCIFVCVGNGYRGLTGHNGLKIKGTHIAAATCCVNMNGQNKTYTHPTQGVITRFVAHSSCHIHDNNFSVVFGTNPIAAIIVEKGTDNHIHDLELAGNGSAGSPALIVTAGSTRNNIHDLTIAGFGGASGDANCVWLQPAANNNTVKDIRVSNAGLLRDPVFDQGTNNNVVKFSGSWSLVVSLAGGVEQENKVLTPPEWVSARPISVVASEDSQALAVSYNFDGSSAGGVLLKFRTYNRAAITAGNFRVTLQIIG